MSTPVTKASARPKASDKGRYRCAVFFKNHRIANGSAFTMHSNKNQDNRNVSVGRFKRLILKGDRFAGKVNWAGIYEDNRLIWEFHETVGSWQLPK